MSLGFALAPVALIAAGPEEKNSFIANYEKKPFLVHHRLAGHELFQIPALLELVRRAQSPDRLYYNVGDTSIGGGWDFNPGRPFSAEVAFERIESANAWMILKNLQKEPAYGELLEAFWREVSELSGCDLKETFDHLMAVIITSPNRVSPYHMDGESNFLLQLNGSKTVHVFNGSDRGVVTDEELEKFWSGDLNAAVYKEERQKEAFCFELVPGTGVHIPITYPHWVKNSNAVSISVGLQVRFKDQRLKNLYQMNARLRQRGLKPKPPGESLLHDRAKLALFSLERIFRK